MNTALTKIPPNSGNVNCDWCLDEEVLLNLGDPQNPNGWRLKDAFEGTQIFGGTGSGKSSGSGQAIARQFLEGHLGGLVLTAKRDEADEWVKYASKWGDDRHLDVVIFSPHHKSRFNFLRYALEKEISGAGSTENLVNLFISVLEVAEKKSGGGGSNDNYWQRTLKQLLRNAIDLCILATGTLSLEALSEIIASAPAAYELTEIAEQKKTRDQFFCLKLIDLAEQNKSLNASQQHDLELTRQFWETEFPHLAPETRSVIISTFTSMADCFLRGTLYELFCTDLNITPEDCWEDGKIIILDLPVKEYSEVGQFAQAVFKYLWQRAVERRIPPTMNSKAAERQIRPVFLWADESQFFANSYDAKFQSTARSSRACTVYLTQNLPSYQAAFGGPNAKADTETFLGNLVTKVFHANGDPVTNLWASESIGRERVFLQQSGASRGLRSKGDGTHASSGINETGGISETIAFAVEPQVFTLLKRGGLPECQVSSVIFQSGRQWIQPDGSVKNYCVHNFDQNAAE